MDRVAQDDVYNKIISESDISPDCMTKKEVYVNPEGHVFPCCQIAGTYTNVDFDGVGNEYVMRDRMKKSAEEFVEHVGYLDLNGSNIVEQLAKSGWQEKITHCTTVDKKLVCVKACARNIRQLIEGEDKGLKYVKFV
jgi:hypothetical protein